MGTLLKIGTTETYNSLKRLAIVGLFLLLAGCGGASGGPSGAGDTPDNNDSPQNSPNLISIQVSPGNLSIAIESGQQLVATAIYDDNSHEDVTNDVEWSSSDSTTVSINNLNSKGYATALRVGNVVVTAMTSDISGTTNFTVSPATLVQLELSPLASTAALGSDKQFSVIGIYSDNSKQDLASQVDWGTSNSSVASIDELGLATANGEGATNISAVFDSVSSNTSFTVTAAQLLSIQVSPSQQSIPLGSNIEYSASGTYSDGSTQDITSEVTWSSSASGVAQTANNQEIFESVASGSASIIATLNSINGSTTLTVTSAVLQRIEVTPADTVIALGIGLQLQAIGYYSDETTEDLTEEVTWESSNSSVAEIYNVVGNEGKLSSFSMGSITVTATLLDLSASTGVEMSSATLERIEIPSIATEIPLGNSVQFNATGIFSDGSSSDISDQVTWASNNRNIAIVSNQQDTVGLVSTVNSGAVTISATLDDVSSISNLEVTLATLLSIEITPFYDTIAMGASLQFSAEGYYSDGSSVDITSQVEWTVDNESIALISAGGLITPVTTGTVSVRASFDTTSAMTSLTISDATLTNIEISSSANAIANGTYLSFSATGTYTDNSTQDLTESAIWSSSDNTIVTIGNSEQTNGEARAQSVGEINISASFGGMSDSKSLSVTSATLQSILVQAASSDLMKGTNMQFTATGNYSDATSQDITGQVLWTSSDRSIINISNDSESKGLATGLLAGSADITATLDTIIYSISIDVVEYPSVAISIIVYGAPNVILNNGSDSTIIRAVVQPSTVPDGTMVDFTITEGEAIDEVSLPTVGGEVKFSLIATENYVGPISIEAQVKGTAVSNVTNIYSISDFGSVIGIAGYGNGTYENGMYLAGTWFALLVQNYSNRTFEISEYRFFNIDDRAIICASTEPSDLSDGDLVGGETTGYICEIGSDLTSSGVVEAYLFNDTATSTSFLHGLTFIP